MKLKHLLTALTMVVFVAAAYSQSKLHIPKEIQNAYKKGTRSMDGKPGKNYWHNKVVYDIDVTVSPETRVIDGTETVVFTNNSPDELATVVIRLYYDVFKKGNERGMQVNPEDIGDGVILKSLKVSGMDYDLNQRGLVNRNGTNMEVRLPQPLKTGEDLTLEIAWEQKVPLTVRRTGAIDSSSFFIAYWYPQVAVYDDIFGWDQIDYTFETEFYNNLADFNVNITAPDNFLVWATGELQNSGDVLPESIHKKYQHARTATEVVHVVDAEDLSSLKLKGTTWNYKATEVNDFAFAMSDHFLWDATSLEVSGKDVLIATAFPAEKAEQYTEVTKVQQKTMKHFSEDMPGVPYPYPEFTTFIGLRGGGMEFPMMANNDGPGVGVTVHELFHTYFPMYVRINERRFAWMDEGWADFVTGYTMYNYFNDDPNSGATLYSNFKFGMMGMIGTIGDLPTVTSSQYMGNNYGYHSYGLPAFTYALLYQHLGKEKFLECLRAYINRWAKKSPTPYDFFYTFEDVSGQDLNWLWDSWYFRMGYPDLAIDSYENGRIKIKRNGERLIPVSIFVEYDKELDPSLKKFHVTLSAEVWKDGNRDFEFDIPSADKVKYITINSDFPDFSERDNYYPSLPERYKEMSINEDLLGTYALKEFPVNLVISKEEGVLKLEITNSPISGYLLPVDKLNLVTTDGSMQLELTEKDSKITDIKLSIAAFGVTVTGSKQ
jgi:hypothetical protein